MVTIRPEGKIIPRMFRIMSREPFAIDS